MQQGDGKGVSCQREGCSSRRKPYLARPDLYRKSGKTTGGTQRTCCKTCGSTFKVGHPARNQHRQSKNGQVLSF